MRILIKAETEVSLAVEKQIIVFVERKIDCVFCVDPLDNALDLDICVDAAALAVLDSSDAYLLDRKSVV